LICLKARSSQAGYAVNALIKMFWLYNIDTEFPLF